VRVRFDDQIFTMQKRGGVSRYFVELIRAFSENPKLGVDAQPGWRWTRNRHAMEAGLGTPLPMLGESRGVVLRAANRAANIAQPATELIHHTWYRAGYLPRKPARPTAVTIYDMTPELFPDLFPRGNPHQLKREYVRRASVVLCISENTRRDLLQVYGSIESPVVVTHLGVGDEFLPGVTRPVWCPDSYVLFVGNRGGYKNFRLVLESFAELAPQQSRISLLALGGGRFTEEEGRLISRWGLGNRVLQRAASDAELPGIYGGAEAFVFPSRYEGFGLPALEAMACGTPTVLADSSSLPEIGGDAALYFPPENASALAAQLCRLLTDSELRRHLSKQGLERARHFTWQRTAACTANAYRVAAGNDAVLRQ
jgi:glycosyltransferase involved in cell wall biosynthesis